MSGPKDSDRHGPMPRRRREDSDEESDSDDLEDDDDTDWAPEDSKHKAKACTAAQVKRASKRQATSSKRASEDSTDDDLDSEYEKLRRANMKRNALVLKVCVRCLVCIVPRSHLQ